VEGDREDRGESAPDSETYWSYEDAPSNWLGAEFYLYHDTNDENLTKSIDLFLFARNGAADPQNAPYLERHAECSSGPKAVS
jgi:hypothetical protein